MKLYTEKQVTKINLQSKDWGHYDNSIFAFVNVVVPTPRLN